MPDRTNLTTGVAESTLAMTGPEVVAALAADPLADRFHVDVFSDGSTDVFGDLVHVHTRTKGLPVYVVLFDGEERRFGMSRMAAIELRDALDVAIRATRKNTGE